MSCKRQTRERTVSADPVYNNTVVTELVNQIMLGGKKGIAQEIVCGAFERIREKTGKEPVEVFEAAMNNIMPVLEIKAKRTGGAIYQVPIEMKSEKRQAFVLRWLMSFSHVCGEKTQEERLAAELMDATNNTGSTVKRKEDTHKMAEANRAFARHRF